MWGFPYYVSPSRRLPSLILTPATCRISTLVKLNSEFEMGLEWARKWEAELIYSSQKFTSFTQEGRGPSPTSPGCKCRRCSLLHIDECDPKEVSSLFKFLRKRKVICPNWKSMGKLSGQWSARCWSVGPFLAIFEVGIIQRTESMQLVKLLTAVVARGVLCELCAQVIN